jgi:hypothetical protein
LTEGDEIDFDDSPVPEKQILEDIDEILNEPEIFFEDHFDEYIVEYALDKHHPEEISNNLFMALKGREECLSSVVLKLFDSLLEKDSDYSILNQLVLDYFNEAPVYQFPNDLLDNITKWALYPLGSSETKKQYLDEASSRLEHYMIDLSPENDIKELAPERHDNPSPEKIEPSSNFG